MKWLLLPTMVAFSALTAITGQAQTSQDCPPGLVCISREAALKALENADEVKALRNQVSILEKAFEDAKKLVEEANRNFIVVSTQNTELRQQKVEDRALIELLIKKRKCASLSICIGS